MPKSPLLGLSIMIHLGVILLFKLFGFNINKPRNPFLKRPEVIKRFSLGIIGSIFFLIIANAVVLTNTALEEKHSSINFLKNTVTELNKYSNSDNNYSTINYIIN